MDSHKILSGIVLADGENFVSMIKTTKIYSYILYVVFFIILLYSISVMPLNNIRYTTVAGTAVADIVFFIFLICPALYIQGRIYILTDKRIIKRSRFVYPYMKSMNIQGVNSYFSTVDGKYGLFRRIVMNSSTQQKFVLRLVATESDDMLQKIFKDRGIPVNTIL